MRVHHFLTIGIAGACLLAAPATAQEESRPPLMRQAFTLDPETGCFDYKGTAAEFVGRFKRGSYVTVTMQSLDDTGLLVPASQEERIPLMGGPGHPVDSPLSSKAYWFGPLPQTGPYTVTFMPRSLIGHPATVLICGRTFAPGSPEEAAHRNKTTQDQIDTDPYTKALLDTPKTLVENDKKAPNADVCGFPVRDVILKAVNGSEVITLQPRVTGIVRHYGGVLESPFPVVATCLPADAGTAQKPSSFPTTRGIAISRADDWNVRIWRTVKSCPWGTSPPS